MKTSLLSIGFRPFFLLGALSSVAFMSLWLLSLMGQIQIHSVFDTVTWHAHEMLFGFSLAVLLGFLLTASQNWSGLAGVKGRPLLLLIGLWLLGRLLIYVSWGHWLELALLPAAMVLLRPHLWLKENTRNRKILGLLFALWCSDLLIHSGQVEVGRVLALDLFVGFIIIIAGRIIPFFRSRALAEPAAENIVWIDQLSAGLFFLYALAPAFDLAKLRVVAAGGLFLIQAFRWWRWRPLRSLRPSILGILYIGYFWLLLGFLLMALSEVFNIPRSLGLHLFTVGVLGVFMMGMMSRVSLGHTGRPIRASSLTVLSYIFVHLALVLRAFVPLFWSEKYYLILVVSGGAWILAFLVFLIEYFNILLLPRPDGKA